MAPAPTTAKLGIACTLAEQNDPSVPGSGHAGLGRGAAACATATRARSGFKTNRAINAATTFITLAVRKTARHPPPAPAITLLNGTSSAAVPFAVYSRP